VLEDFENTKKRGDAGVGSAIGWFTSQGYTVSIPLTDSQDYDLVVDINNTLNRVQIKTVFHKPDGFYAVNLRVTGGNKHCTTNKLFDNTAVEYLYVLTNEGVRYFIPAAIIETTTQLRLNERYTQYIV
jgi:hypothetical protein